MADAAARSAAAGPRFAPAPTPAWRQRGRGRQQAPCLARAADSLRFGCSGGVAGASLHAAAPPRRGRRGRAPPPAAVAVPGKAEVAAANPKDADEVCVAFSLHAAALCRRLWR
jgi:hypothetical protein